MKKIILVTIALVSVIGCAPILENMPGFTHTAALIVGENRNNVLSQAEHIVGHPKAMENFKIEGANDVVEIVRYNFTVIYDLTLYFYKDIFIQAGLIEPTSKNYTMVRGDYKEVRKGSPGPVSFVLTRDRKNASIKTVYRKGEEPKEEKLEETLKESK